MAITLTLSSSSLDKEALQDTMRGLCHDLRDEAHVNAALLERPAAPGEKGIPWDQIVIAVISSGGAVVALIGVLKAYVQRKESLEIELQNACGESVKIKAENLNAKTISELTSFLEKAKVVEN